MGDPAAKRIITASVRADERAANDDAERPLKLETLSAPRAVCIRIPRTVAAVRSRLPTPTPTRPITRNLVPAASNSPRTFVALHTTNPCALGNASMNDGSEESWTLRISKRPSARSDVSPDSETLSVTRTV